jgi:serine/threonine protein kinase
MAMANLVGVDLAAAYGVLGGVVDDRYRLEGLLGEGSAATAYAARDGVSGERRALKFFRAGHAATALRAAEEFRRLHEISHRNVVRVWDLGRSPDGTLYLVTDEVRGPPVTSVASIAAGAARRTAFEAVARDLADALAYLHARGVVHGDIAPANIRLDDDGRPVLFDFGLAGIGAPPRAGGAFGTLGYASPEALVGQRGPAGDLFSLGATLFEVWTGTPPFGVGMPAVRRMLSGQAPSLSAVREGLSAAWDQILSRLLAPRPEDRFPSARELLRAIGHASAGTPSSVELDLRAPYPGGDPLAGIVVGRQSERATLRAALERLAEGAAR